MRSEAYQNSDSVDFLLKQELISIVNTQKSEVNRKDTAHQVSSNRTEDDSFFCEPCEN